MAGPGVLHQYFVNSLWLSLYTYVNDKKGGCYVSTAPCDVKLSEDKPTIVQPDVFIVCDRKKLSKKRVNGEPDLIIEVRSETNKQYDMSIKLLKYIETVVREYWMVDPEEEKVLVYKLENKSLPMIYGFEDKIPVHIFNNDCTIDFKGIFEGSKSLYKLEEL